MALLLVGALGAAAFVYFAWGRKDKGAEDKPRHGRAAFSFKRQDVATLALQRDGRRTVIESRGDNWVITQPVDAPADQSIVNPLLDELAAVTSSRANPGLTGWIRQR
jgi:hypothetical protein